jgi:hypothetical protein
MSDVSASKKGKKDTYSNRAYGTVTASAANTLTFAQIQMAVGLFQGIGMLIHRVLFYPSTNSSREMVAATDLLIMAVTTSSRITSLATVAEPALITSKRLVGIGVAVAVEEVPYINDFTGLPGGGKLVAANPLFVAVETAGAVAASVVSVEIDFTFLQLNDRDYLELIQGMFPSNI